MSMLKTLFRLEKPIIRIGLSHRILPNDQEEGSYHEGRQEEARSGSNETVSIMIGICKGDGIDEYQSE